MALMTALFGWLILMIAPETSIGRFLRSWTVQGPARLLNRITRGHVLVTIGLLLAVSGVVFVMESDGVRLLAMGAPELVTWLTMFEISSVADAAFAGVLIATTVRWSGVRTRIAAIVRPRNRQRRHRRDGATQAPAANDDEPHRPLVRAA